MLAATLPWFVISSHLTSEAGSSWQVGHETSKEKPATRDVSTEREVSPHAGEGRACQALIFLSDFILKYLKLWLTYFREGKQIGQMASHRAVLKGHGL